MKNCPHCGAIKYNFASNGRCFDCERARGKQVWREKQGNAESYLDRHLQRRERESIEPVFEVGEADTNCLEETSPIEQHGAVGFGKPDSGFSSLISINKWLHQGKNLGR